MADEYLGGEKRHTHTRGQHAEGHAGCILPGENRKRGTVMNSRIWEKHICNVLASRKEGEAAWIRIE